MPTFADGVFGYGVGGTIREEDTDILDMWNGVIAEMSTDGTTAEITKKGLVEIFLCKNLF